MMTIYVVWGRVQCLMSTYMMRYLTQHDSQYEKACGKQRLKSEYQTQGNFVFLGDGEEAFFPSPAVEWGGAAAEADAGRVWSERGALDGFGWILLADEDLQKPQFGFNALVLFVFVHHRHAVFLLNIPVRERTFCFENNADMMTIRLLTVNSYLTVVL